MKKLLILFGIMSFILNAFFVYGATPDNHFSELDCGELSPIVDAYGVLKCPAIIKHKYSTPNAPVSAPSISSNLDVSPSSITTLINTEGVIEKEIVIKKNDLIDVSVSNEEVCFNLTKQYQDQIINLNQSLSEERKRVFELERELNQSKIYAEELRFNLTSEINKLKEEIKFSGITGFFMKIFD